MPKPEGNQKQFDPTSFLKKYPVSLVNVDNLTEEPLTLRARSFAR